MNIDEYELEAIADKHKLLLSTELINFAEDVIAKAILAKEVKKIDDYLRTYVAEEVKKIDEYLRDYEQSKTKGQP